MKVAVATNDFVTVGQHYGQAKFFLVLTMEAGEVVTRDVRRRPGSLTAAAVGFEGRDPEVGRGRRSARLVSDCDAVIAGGMGRGAYENLKRVGVEPVLTDERRVDDAAMKYCRGDLPSLTVRIHDGYEGGDRELRGILP